MHANGTMHSHGHAHSGEHVHVHEETGDLGDGVRDGGSMTPWVLFTIFLFGPCEPLIPLLMYPAAKGNMWGVGLES